jgi:predicted DNA-binding transcriptional regulator AlpA
MTRRLQDTLAYPPRGLRAPRAAAYIGMSESSFLALVEEGVMPRPVKIKGMTIWDRHELDVAFEALKPHGTDEPRRKNTADVIMGLDKDD